MSSLHDMVAFLEKQIWFPEPRRYDRYLKEGLLAVQEISPCDGSDWLMKRVFFRGRTIPCLVVPPAEERLRAQ